MNPIGLFAIPGAISGALATPLFFYLPEDWELQPLSWLEINPATTMPGLVFGVIIGLALYRRDLLAGWRFAAYAAASTLSYLVAVTLATKVLEDVLGSLLTIGLVAGLFGGACLTALSALLMPVVRQAKPCLFMLLAGCLFGGLLNIVGNLSDVTTWMIFFAAWQAGYAAALATALPTWSMST